MNFFKLFSFLCCFGILSTTGSLEAKSNLAKKAYIITGSECSGSKFISKVIAYVLGKDKEYFSWKGYGYNGKIGDDIVLLHRSQPHKTTRHDKKSRFIRLQDFESDLKGYQIYYIITTRDKNIVGLSKKHRFRRTDSRINSDYEMSKSILSEIIQKRKHFIWNYETYQYLGQSYLKQLYKFLGVSSNFIPPNSYDGNEKYIK